MELSFEGEDYNLYSVPVLINGEEYNMQVVYDFTVEEWSILGAAPGLDESGMAAKELRLLREGDVITTLWKSKAYSGEGDFGIYTAEEITVTADTAFGEAQAAQKNPTLDFLPVETVPMYLITETAFLGKQGFSAILEIVRSQDYRTILKHQTGYQVTHTGELIQL